MKQVVDFAALYSGNTSAYGSDWGSCIHRPLTLAVYNDHLHGNGIGVFPIRVINGEAMVKFCGTDIDVQDWGRASAFATALTCELGIFCHIERSRSKGYHCLVFLSDWTPAVVARHAMLYVHDITGVPPVEAYPKQSSVAELKHGLGNYLRLGYPGGLVAAKPSRQVMLWNEHEEQSLSEFLEVAKGSLCAPERLAEIAECYTPPEPRHVAPVGSHGPLQWPEGPAAELARKAGGLAYTIFKEGPLEGSDRSTTMARLAHLCADNGLSPTEVFKILAGLPWSKFVGRSDHDEQILKLVEGAFLTPTRRDNGRHEASDG